MLLQKKSRDAHEMVKRIGPVYEMPVYNHPSDTRIYHENQAKFHTFKKRLIGYFKRKHEERVSREKYLQEEYEKLMAEWLKKLEKKETSVTKKAKDNKLREFFEKQFPELRKQREDKERLSRAGQRIRSDVDLEEVMDGLHEQELEDKKMRSYAVIPPILYDTTKTKQRRFINRNGIVEKPVEEYKELQYVNVWSEGEKTVFREKYLQHPKNFGLIASFLDRKSVADCVQYYYMSKKRENYKQLLRKHVKKRTRALVRAQQQQQEQRQAAQQGQPQSSQPARVLQIPENLIIPPTFNDIDLQSILPFDDRPGNMLGLSAEALASICLLKVLQITVRGRLLVATFI